jgi:hypothetical protein
VDLHMLTTVDNPYDPFTEYDSWAAFDERAGYHTPQFLARIAVTSHDLSDEDQSLAIESAIEEIVQQNVTGMYRKVKAPEGFVA